MKNIFFIVLIVCASFEPLVAKGGGSSGGRSGRSGRSGGYGGGRSSMGGGYSSASKPKSSFSRSSANGSTATGAKPTNSAKPSEQPKKNTPETDTKPAGTKEKQTIGTLSHNSNSILPAVVVGALAGSWFGNILGYHAPKIEHPTHAASDGQTAAHAEPTPPIAEQLEQCKLILAGHYQFAAHQDPEKCRHECAVLLATCCQQEVDLDAISNYSY